MLGLERVGPTLVLVISIPTVIGGLSLLGGGIDTVVRGYPNFRRILGFSAIMLGSVAFVAALGNLRSID